jgi:hypothetical protein
VARGPSSLNCATRAYTFVKNSSPTTTRWRPAQADNRMATASFTVSVRGSTPSGSAARRIAERMRWVSACRNSATYPLASCDADEARQYVLGTLFTVVRGGAILRTSPKRRSRKFAAAPSPKRLRMRRVFANDIITMRGR